MPWRPPTPRVTNLYSGSGQSCGGFAATDQAFLSTGAAPVANLVRRADQPSTESQPSNCTSMRALPSAVLLTTIVTLPLVAMLTGISDAG